MKVDLRALSVHSVRCDSTKLRSIISGSVRSIISFPYNRYSSMSKMVKEEPRWKVVSFSYKKGDRDL